MSDVNFCFVVCEKLLQNHIYITDKMIVSDTGEEYECSVEVITYFVQRLFFRSSKTFTLYPHLDEIIQKYMYIFQFELASSNALVNMLA